MIHEDLEGEALKDEVLRVARRGAVYDVDATMTEEGKKEGIETAWLGKREASDGTEMVFRFYLRDCSATAVQRTIDRPAMEAALRRMVKNCDVLLKEIAWHPHSGSGVLTVLWDSVVPMSEVMDSVRLRPPSSEDNRYRRYVS